MKGTRNCAGWLWNYALKNCSSKQVPYIKDLQTLELRNYDIAVLQVHVYT